VPEHLGDRVEVDIRRSLPAFNLDVSFSAESEIVTLFGHSGSGKSLTLRAIAGLLRPDSGTITIGGRTLFDAGRDINVAPHHRQLGFMVQQAALFPHMTVARNILFGAPRGARTMERASALLAQFGLAGMEGRMPRTLSGGQQQRVALARALARDSRVLLLDEPFSALDESLRSSLRRELLRLRADLGLTILFVTHDLREAHLLADRLAVFDGGRILQFDARETVFRHPASRRVAQLTGVANVLSGTVQGTDESPTVLVEGLALVCAPQPHVSFSPGETVDIAIRAERVNLRRTSAETLPPNTFLARVVEEFAYGSSHTLRMEPLAVGPAVDVEIAARPYEVLGIAAQKEWLVELPSEDLHVMCA
jgi:ABC-type sulfate/molybdate transport systems ATPase subunit